jgi:hypothetical protein
MQYSRRRQAARLIVRDEEDHFVPPVGRFLMPESHEAPNIGQEIIDGALRAVNSITAASVGAV